MNELVKEVEDIGLNVEVVYHTLWYHHDGNYFLPENLQLTVRIFSDNSECLRRLGFLHNRHYRSELTEKGKALLDYLHTINAVTGVFS